jgi:DNA (cytosine-5)-methyltransferase 1
MALGFEQAGFDVLGAVDLDPIHLAAHERNFPLCEPVSADVAEISAAELVDAAHRGWERRHPDMSFAGPVDCIFGGPSCQGFSVIGSRNRDDPRNALVAEFARLVVEMRPRWFVMENVPGLASAGYRPILDAFRHTLEAADYQVVEPWRLNAREHGVPQERLRVFVVGARAGEVLPTAPAAESSVPTVVDALGDLPALSRFRKLHERDTITLSAEQLAAMQRRQSEYVRRLNGVQANRDDLADVRAWDAHVLTSVGLAVHSAPVVARFQRLQRGERDEIGRLPKLDPNGQCPTLRAGTGRDHGSFTSARPVHYSSPRVIAVREAARLHGFPDWFGFHETKWHGFRQVGNAVPPPLARAVAQTVVGAAGVDPSRRTGEPLELGPTDLLSMPMSEAARRFQLDPAKLPINVRTVAAREARVAA